MHAGRPRRAELHVLLRPARVDAPAEPGRAVADESFRDRPGPGHWVYRVAATVGLDGPTQWGNFMAFSRRAAANVSG